MRAVLCGTWKRHRDTFYIIWPELGRQVCSHAVLGRVQVALCVSQQQQQQGRVEEKRPARLPPSRASRPSSLSSLFVLNVRRCDRCTCALCRLRTRNRSGAFLYGAPRAILHLRREHMSRLPSAPPSTSPPPSSPLPRASLPRDCPILRPRAGLLLSRACDSPFAMSFGATYAHASPLILAARCVVAAACLRRDMSSALQACSRLCAHISMLPNLACSLILSILLSCSQDDRDAHQLCSGEDGCAQQRDHVVGVFPRRDEDCVGIGRQDDQSLGFGCAAPSNRPFLAKTDACWLVWQTSWRC